jgi:predicted signal transduction protein with EAL and GGDEF domain
VVAGTDLKTAPAQRCICRLLSGSQAIKIDRSFISNLSHGDEGVQLVRTIIAMARSLNLSVVAEGVETEQQLAVLQQLGCEASQGYLFSRPLSAQAAAAYLAEATEREPAVPERLAPAFLPSVTGD